MRYLGFRRSKNKLESMYSLGELNNLAFPSITFIHSTLDMTKYGDRFFEYLMNHEADPYIKFKIGYDSIEIIKNPGAIISTRPDEIDISKYFVLFISGLKKINNLHQLNKRFSNLGYSYDRDSITFLKSRKIISTENDKEILNYIFNNLRNKLNNELYIVLRLMIERGNL